MQKNRLIKISVALMLFVALWLVIPKVYNHSLLRRNHTLVNTQPETKLEAQPGDDVNLKEYNKPVYFNIFKFISGFIPLKP